MKKDIVSSELIINYINSLLTSLYQKTVILEFYIVENNLFLSTEYKEGSNNVISSKTKLNVDIDDISLLYIELYNLFKDNYINNDNVRVQVIKEIDFKNIDNPYLSLRIHDIHQNEIDLRFRNLNNEKNVINTIEKDLLNIYENKRTSRNI